MFEKKETDEEYECMEDVNCFIDGLIIELLKYDETNKSIVHELNIFLSGEEYDTDGFLDDYNDFYGHSQVTNAIKGDRIINNIISDYLHLYLNATNEYGCGIRFFYWPFYKNNNDEINVIYTDPKGTRVTESNYGYRLKDWYVEARYSSFKLEILVNPKAPFSINDWNETKTKVITKYKAWKKNPLKRKLYCGYRGVNDDGHEVWLADAGIRKCYGIAVGTEISIDHLMAILFYTNYSVQSYEFSASFRRIF
eukprot:273510_1